MEMYRTAKAALQSVSRTNSSIESMHLVNAH